MVNFIQPKASKKMAVLLSNIVDEIVLFIQFNYYYHTYRTIKYITIGFMKKKRRINKIAAGVPDGETLLFLD